MQTSDKREDIPAPHIEDLMRVLVSAIRAVKLYPPNNPVYSQSVSKSCQALQQFLAETGKELRISVQKTFFSYRNQPLGKDGQLNKTIAQDLYAKGMREIIFTNGFQETHLLEFLTALALPSEELAMRSGISSILWQKGVSHIKVIEAGLDDVLTTKAEGDEEIEAIANGAPHQKQHSGENTNATGRTVMIEDLMKDPAGFAAGLVKIASENQSDTESTDDRLLSLYQEAGRKIQEKHADQSDVLFERLANSALSLERAHRQGLIAGKLYKNMDSDIVREQNLELEEQLPNKVQEILTGRFADSWNSKQVAVLLKKAAEKKAVETGPIVADSLKVEPIPPDIIESVKNFSEYTPEEMETLKAVSEAGMESDIIEAATRTLLFLLPLVKSSSQSKPSEKDIQLFSSVVRQLEDMVIYLLQKKDYDLATLIMRALRIPVDASFKPRMTEAMRKTASKTAIAAAIGDLKKYTKDSAKYHSVRSYLVLLERESTESLLELLADEQDRMARDFLLNVLKDIGKNQITFIGEHLSDTRWYVVRNIVSILGESKADQAVAFLSRVADHKSVQIRQEVIKGLITIGGKKAAALLVKFLNDKNQDIRFQAVRGFTEISGIGPEDVKALAVFLMNRPVKRKGQELTFEAIRALGRIGNRSSAEFLARYDRIRWWKPRKIQVDLREAALRAREEIERREANG